MCQVYLAAAGTPASNLSLLDDMLECRKQLAQLLGFPSYAAFKVADATLAGVLVAADLVKGMTHAIQHISQGAIFCPVQQLLWWPF
jgi:Zn-dependent oligopeptidase